jgi:toxin-antitoxin system PIN domain toxin
MYLLDINVWLALSFDSHLHHPNAKQWFDALSDQRCFFCRVTQLGFLRLATNEKIFGSHALNLNQAWNAYGSLRRDNRIAFADEPPDIEREWQNLTQADSKSPHLWGDAYLAAFAKKKSWDVVSFDRGFLQYKDLSCIILS